MASPPPQPYLSRVEVEKAADATKDHVGVWKRRTEAPITAVEGGGEAFHPAVETGEEDVKTGVVQCLGGGEEEREGGLRTSGVSHPSQHLQVHQVNSFMERRCL